ncbi:MAG TPA: coenzyme F420 hydrogenase [Planctomycetes bacterium]|nr:coenzyme F420 hydrogenase [Planctomycetota bacterium]
MTRVRSIRDVAEQHLCAGCGVCAYLAPDRIRMVDDLERGRRPIVDGADGESGDAFEACPGHQLSQGPMPPGAVRELFGEWGPVLEVWEGYASDPELRHAASSGGAASALALAAIEAQGFHGLLHIRARADHRWLNETVLSTTPDEILAATGSRYAPASPCDGLARIEEAPAPCVFIGKPCDVAATRKARVLRPRLDEKLGATIAIFCAGAPSTAATLELMRETGVEDPAELASLRYRGLGWPGHWRAERTDGHVEPLTYAESWGKLQASRPWRCYVCPDHTGEFADIAVGDPWYREVEEGDEGRSLVLVRTERGRELVRAAMASGHIHLERREPSVLPAAQPNLERTRGAIWGRILVTRLLGAAAPRYRGIAMFPSWWKRLNLREKLGSLLGTAKRTFKKQLRVRRPVRAWSDSADS